MMRFLVPTENCNKHAPQHPSLSHFSQLEHVLYSGQRCLQSFSTWGAIFKCSSQPIHRRCDRFAPRAISAAVRAFRWTKKHWAPPEAYTMPEQGSASAVEEFNTEMDK
jgi:hypothetical protein